MLGTATTLGGDVQNRLNESVWRSEDFVSGWYTTRLLRPVEVLLLVRYREALRGRVLELGCGGGRLTGYLVQIGGNVLGIDISPRMVDYCRQTYPEGTYRVGDLGRLADLERGVFDVVVMGNNLIDVLDNASRLRTISEIATLLTQGGLLIMSSHNRACDRSPLSPLRAARGGGVITTLRHGKQIPWWILNRRRLRRYEYEAETYAVRNDEAHDFRLLHYYVTRDDQERQFEEVGYHLIECFDQEGRLVARGSSAAHDGELHYVARPATKEHGPPGPP